MIDGIHLTHFKCFDKLDLPLGKLTLLTGQNSTGKSSAIQSLLLLHQSHLTQGTPKQLLLNGDSVSLGSMGDVVNSFTGRDEFKIGFSSDKQRIEWRFKTDDKLALVVPIKSVAKYVSDAGNRFVSDPILPSKQLPKKTKAELVKRLREILHVSNERVGPTETHSADTSEASGLRLGAHAEYTAWYLHKNADQHIPEELQKEGAPPSLERQTEAWLRDFFPHLNLKITAIPDTQLVSLQFRTHESGKYHRPENVGYGFSHLLPVIVGGLSSTKSKTLIIENPESHLHPSAQTKVGMFLAKVAQAGGQVIVESHSDHVLNGIRLAVKRKLISPEYVKIHYFIKDIASNSVTSPKLNSKGQINNWPNGFFDQFENDLDELTVWG